MAYLILCKTTGTGSYTSWATYDGTQDGSVTSVLDYDHDTRSVDLLSSTKAIIAYNDRTVSSSRSVKAVVFDINGTTITEGTDKVVEQYSGTGTTDMGDECSICALSATTAVMAWRHRRGNSIHASILTISGSTISSTTPVVVSSSSALATGQPSIHKVDDTHAILFWSEYEGDDKTQSKVLTISGSTITEGTPTTLVTERAQNLEATPIASGWAIDSNKPTGKINTVVATVSGTTITASNSIESTVNYYGSRDNSIISDGGDSGTTIYCATLAVNNAYGWTYTAGTNTLTKTTADATLLDENIQSGINGSTGVSLNGEMLYFVIADSDMKFIIVENDGGVMTASNKISMNFLGGSAGGSMTDAVKLSDSSFLILSGGQAKIVVK